MWLPWEYKKKTTPEHKRQIDHGVALLLRQVFSLRFRKHPPAFFGANNSPILEVTPLQRQFSIPSGDATPESRLRHLQSLIRTLQKPPNFRLTSGSYPQACEWTSTVLATILIDYCHQTADNQYFPDFVAFHRHQPVCHLITQKNDDKLWVVMTYLRGAAYAAGRNEKLRAKFLKRAKFFYYQAKWGWDDSTCGGGMYWGQCSRYKNAVTIELYVTVSIRMYEVFGEEWMLAAALRGWVWFKQSGMINPEGLVNDGLDDNGLNNDETTWTYNQGIILSGLSKLYEYTGDPEMFRAAESLLDAVLTSPLVPSNSGILVESRDPSGTCDQDQRMFKGVFFEHLAYFLRDMVILPELPTSTKISLLRKYSGFVYANAAAVWNDAGGRDGMISSWWAIPGGGIGPRQTSVETLGSGISAVSCAVLVDTLLESLEGVSGSEMGV